MAGLLQIPFAENVGSSDLVTVCPALLNEVMQILHKSYTQTLNKAVE